MAVRLCLVRQRIPVFGMLHQRRTSDPLCVSVAVAKVQAAIVAIFPVSNPGGMAAEVVIRCITATCGARHVAVDVWSHQVRVVKVVGPGIADQYASGGLLDTGQSHASSIGRCGGQQADGRVNAILGVTRRGGANISRWAVEYLRALQVRRYLRKPEASGRWRTCVIVCSREDFIIILEVTSLIQG